MVGLLSPLSRRVQWFLYGVEIPLVVPRDEDFGMYFRLVRRW